MRSDFLGCTKLVLAASGLLLVAAGCGQSFQSTTGASGSSGAAGAGGTGGAAGTSAGAAGSATGGTGGTTPAECMEGHTQKCYDGDPNFAGKGICAYGVQTCKAGQWGPCVGGDTMPTAETCDGKDSDCDGIKNNGCSCMDGQTMSCFPFGGGAMAGNGPCKSGTQSCVGGMWSSQCDGAVGPDPETCNNMGADNDCNGENDDIPNLGSSCMTGKQGVCAVGTKQCNDSGSLGCMGPAPSAETCNSQDDNCDGTVDNLPMPTCSLTVGGTPCSGVNKCNGSTPNCGPHVWFMTDFADNGGWDAQGQWSIDVAQTGGGMAAFPDPASDHSPSPDNKLAGVEIGGDVSTQIGQKQYLTSPTIDLTKGGVNTAFLSFYHWLNSDIATSMKHTVEVSADDGASWTVVWSNGDAQIKENNWALQQINISMYMSQHFRVRFGVSVFIAAQGWSSWNVDDLVISSCPPG